MIQNVAKKPKEKLKQEELPGAPSSELRDIILEWIEKRELVGDLKDKEKEAADNVRKALREAGKKSVRIEKNDGTPVIVKLVPTGEKVAMAIIKEKKGVKKEDGTEVVD